MKCFENIMFVKRTIFLSLLVSFLFAGCIKEEPYVELDNKPDTEETTNDENDTYDDDNGNDDSDENTDNDDNGNDDPYENTDNGESDFGSEDWVDLGLPSGLLWATRNVGASSPTDYGDYFAWGEISPKSSYTENNYRFYHYDSVWSVTKYYGGDGLTTLQTSDDAATVNYGGRMPTRDEWDELKAYTISKWLIIDGVYGCCFTASNGNSLFLPAAGAIYYGTELESAGSRGLYWSATIGIDDWSARYFYFDSDYVGWRGSGGRNYGLPVRAVRSAR